MERGHSYTTLDSLDVRLRSAEHLLTQHTRQIRGHEVTQINLQNSAASAVQQSQYNQVQSLTARVKDLETGGNSLTPLGRGLMIPLMISEHALWP